MERIGGRDSRTAPVRVAARRRRRARRAARGAGRVRLRARRRHGRRARRRCRPAATWSTSSRRPAGSRSGSSCSATRSSASRRSRRSRSGRCATSGASPSTRPRSCSTTTARPRFADDDGAVEIPSGLVSLAPELLAAGAVVAWQPRLVASEARGAPVRGRRPPAAAKRGLPAGSRTSPSWSTACTRFDALPQGQAVAFEGQRPAIAARGIAEAENELRNLVRAGQRVVVAFPHRGDAERTALQLKRVETQLLEPGAALPVGAGRATSSSRGSAAASSRRSSALSVLPSALLFRRRAADTRLGRAVRSFTDLRPGDYVVHEDHGVGHFVGFDTKTVAGVTRDYLCLDFKGSDKLFVPHEQIAKVSRYIGSDARRAGALEARRQGLAHAQGARAASPSTSWPASCSRCTPHARRREKVPVDPDGELVDTIERAFPYTETDDQARAIEAVKVDLETPPPDGPPDLRRRRLRQDRGRDARGGEGRRVGPAGADAGADHDPRPAALRDLPRPLPRHARSRSSWSRGSGRTPS